MKTVRKLLGFVLILSTALATAQSRILTENGFENCIELSNKNVRVVLTPALGGRVLKYELKGKNILYVDPAQNGLTEKPQGMYKGPSAGRFDFGPTRVIPKHDDLWWGMWTSKITGKFSATLTSQIDKATGVQLIRNFELDPFSSRLSVTQTILNVSSHDKRYCYWGRTFVKGGGTTFVPLNKESRFPKKYLAYGDQQEIFFDPENESNLKIQQNTFILNKTSAYKKYVMDGDDGWMAYLSTDNLLFVKKFEVFPDKVYAEMSACTMSVWFSDDQIVEIEPLGPWEWIAPGKSSSYTEEWFLLDFEVGQSSDAIIEQIHQIVQKGNEA